jgi:FkbM family methyltransferase
MEENMGLNNIFDIVTHAEAISEMDGATVLLGNRYGDKIRRLWLGRPMSRARTLTLNSFVTSLGKEIDFVQMDIQGEEFRALKGAAAVMDKIDSFLVGTHGPQLHKNCLSLLQNNGFSIRLNQETVPGQPDGMILAQRIIQG